MTDLKPCLARDAPATCISLGDISPCDNCFSNLMQTDGGDEPMTDKTKLFELYKPEDFGQPSRRFCIENAATANRILNERGIRLGLDEADVNWPCWVRTENVDVAFKHDHEALLICPRPIEKDIEPKCEGLCEGLSNILKSPYEVEVVTNNFCPKCGKDLR